MKPNDDPAKLPPDERPFRILIISGSQRRQYDCPGVDSKARVLMLKMAELLPSEWEIDYISQKGKVHPNKYRAYGHTPPSHHWADVKDGIKYFRMMIGNPVEIHLLQFNNATWHPKKGEGEKLRDE